jgi:hypothetical protein
MRTNFSVNAALDAKLLVAVLLSFFVGSAHADEFFKLVGYQCDPQADRLILTYGAAANGEGQTMMEAKSATQWDPWDLIEMKDDDHIKTTRSVKASCRLSGGTYHIQLGPVPGNFNLQRSCGAWISAWAEVKLNNKIIYPRTDFESGVGCFFADGEITTRIEIAPGRTKHVITSYPAVDLLSDTSPLR